MNHNRGEAGKAMVTELQQYILIIVGLYDILLDSSCLSDSRANPTAKCFTDAKLDLSKWCKKRPAAALLSFRMRNVRN